MLIFIVCNADVYMCAIVTITIDKVYYILLQLYALEIETSIT